MSRRPKDFSLLAAGQLPGFTPKGADAEPIVLLIAATAEERPRRALSQALGRLPLPTALPPLLAHLATAQPPVRERLAAALGALVVESDGPMGQESAAQSALSQLVVLTTDQDPRTRTVAVHALGRLGDHGPLAEVEAALLARLGELTGAAVRQVLRTPAQRLAMAKALVQALGKVGGPAAAGALPKLMAEWQAAAPELAGDSGLAQVLSKAGLILQREGSRGALREPLAEDWPLPVGTRLVLSTRQGLGELLAEEARAAGLVVNEIALDRVEVSVGGAAVTVADLLGGERGLRLALAVGFPLGLDGQDLGSAAPCLSALSRGTLRYRIAAPGAGKSAPWRLAELWQGRFAAVGISAINDSRLASWELELPPLGTPRLMARAVHDRRFGYRVEQVPAASHPVLAAALASLAGSAAGDRVWDPFVGSGLELIERAKRGPAKAIIGTDLSETALTAARANVMAAGCGDRIHLAVADALTVEQSALLPPQQAFDVIITNPPMGRRVARGQVGSLLRAFEERIPQLLAPRGRLIWLTPTPAASRAHFAALGFRVDRALTVDMGGFSAELQVVSRIAESSGLEFTGGQ